jgi:hypothetical protein
MPHGTCGAAHLVMKTMIKLIAYGTVAAGVVAVVRAARRRQEPQDQVLTEDDLFVDPVVITEEVIIVSEDPDEPDQFTL